MSSILTDIAIAVVEWNESILIGPRPEGVPLAGKWEFPGGKMRPGESPFAAAVRECAEETGLHVETFGEYPVCEQSYDHGSLRLFFIRCRPLPTPQDLSPTPPFRWVERQSLANYSFPEGNATVIEFLLHPE